jgi:hypothetical protein
MWSLKELHKASLINLQTMMPPLQKQQPRRQPTYLLDKRHIEDIQAFTASGAIVYDKNLPTPENSPPPNEPPIWQGASIHTFPADTRGFQGTCCQKLNKNHANRGPSISKPQEIWLSMIKLDYWLLFFPNVYCQSILLPEMDKNLPGRLPIEW